MAKFAIFFSYTPEAWGSMLRNPSDRADAARQLAEAVGGSLESFYWMLGEYDGFAVANVPDAVSAAAVSVAVSSSGAIARTSTHEVFDSDDRDALIDKARAAAAVYSPPTA